MSGTTRQEPSLQIPTKQVTTEAEPAWAKALRESVELLGGHIHSLGNTAKNLQQAPKQQVMPPTKQVETDPFAGMDANTLETLPRHQFMAMMRQSFLEAARREFVEPLKGEVTSLRNGLSTTVAEKQIDKALAVHPDLMEWKDEMMELAKIHPTLAPQALYTLAKANADPKKLETVESKYKKPDEGVAAPKSFTFGGLLPQNGGGEETNKRMAPSEAADDAWDRVVAEMGGAPAFSE